MTDTALNNSIITTVGTVAASNNVLVPIDSLEQTLTYSAGKVVSITVAYDDIDYVQTLTYTGSDLTGISGWVAQ